MNILKWPKSLQLLLFLLISVAGFTFDWNTETPWTSVYLIIVILAGLLFNRFRVHLIICISCTFIRYVQSPSGFSVNHLQVIIAQYAAYQLIATLLAKLKSLYEYNKKIGEKYRSIAYQDTLTGLPNRLNFLETLDNSIHKAKMESKKIALFFLDLNRFKSINDSLGHHTGDLLLKEVAHRLHACLNEQETIYRLGGDEFTVISFIDEINDAQLLAKRIKEQFNTPVLIHDQECYISTSIGISVFPNNGDTAEELIKGSDTAMYRSKEIGDNVHTFYESQQYDNFSLENDLRKALKQNQFTVFFQPKYNVSKNILVGLEALVRWEHPELGFIPPDKFIPIAEKSGLIVPIGEQVLNLICQQIRNWDLRGISIPRIAINFSAKQFKQDNLVPMIQNILNSYEVSPKLIEIEITESAVMYDEYKSSLKIRELKEMGIKFSIDDFGTGYSSFSYLKKYPIDVLKIDQTFIRDIGKNDDNAIVTAIIALANHLNLDVVAEGVENVEQLQFLHQHGCKVIQGFLISKPLRAEEIYEMLLNKSITAAV